MEPFRISEKIKGLKGTYPEAKILLDIAKTGGESARCTIVRQWLSEGIPYAFKDCPAIYDSVRTWISSRLNINQKEVSLTGSARIGQSLAPNKIGKPFDENSDLDIFIVSSELFEQLRKEFNQWSYDYETEVIKASNPTEEYYWTNNLKQCPKNISSGFIDSIKIPNREQYPCAKNIAQTMYLLTGKLSSTQSAPKVSKASVRCYKSWESYVNQVSRNLVI